MTARRQEARDVASKMIRIDDDTHLVLMLKSVGLQHRLGKQVSMGMLVAALVAIANMPENEGKIERLLSD
jgi:hypothetical protein